MYSASPSVYSASPPLSTNALDSLSLYEACASEQHTVNALTFDASNIPDSSTLMASQLKMDELALQNGEEYRSMQSGNAPGNCMSTSYSDSEPEYPVSKLFASELAELSE